MTKTGKKHYKCKTITERKSGTSINDNFRLCSSDPVKFLERLKKSYLTQGIRFEYENLVEDE